MPRLESVLEEGAIKLRPIIGDAAQNEAMILLAHATGRQAATLRFHFADEIDHETTTHFMAMIDQRCKFQPIAQIIGQRAFWKYDFIVTPDVLDPRPDTETLIEQAVGLPNIQTILDLGTGSGCILLSLLGEFTQATGLGVDASEPALEVARKNAAKLGLDTRAHFQLGNWGAGITDGFDLIASNPPYITEDAMQSLSRDVRDWEPRIALTPEGDGLAAYRQIIADVPRLMNPDATLLLEIGYDQGAEVADLLTSHGFHAIGIIQDINGKDRVVSAKYHKIPE